MSATDLVPSSSSLACLTAVLAAVTLGAGLSCGAPTGAGPGAGDGAAGIGPGDGGASGRLDAASSSSEDAGCPGVDLDDGGCAPLTLSRLCAIGSLVVVENGVPTDDGVGRALARALAAGCTPAPAWRAVDGGAVDAAGAPLVPRTETLALGGGPFFQAHVGWLERSGATGVFNSTGGGVASFTSRAGAVVFQLPLSAFDGGQDAFVLQWVRGAPGAPGSLVAYGFFGAGTAAAGWYFEHRVVPQLPAFADAWYVYSWRDTDGDGRPGAGDTWLRLASGR